jgi:uncharacterized membrane protein
MTGYELLTFLHITSAIIWLGAGFLIAVLVLGAIRAGEREREAGYHRDVGWLAPRLFVPASFATLIFGVLLVIDGAWEFDQLWVVIALAGWLVSFVLGFFYFRPEGQRIAGLVQAHGPANAEADARLRRLNIVDRLQLAILFLMVADMVIKPTGDDAGVLIAGAAIAVVATLAAAALTDGFKARTTGVPSTGAPPA